MFIPFPSYIVDGGMIIVITISLCMIAKNEENTLARCLTSVQDIADEIIIVDTGSTDKTKDIAHEYTSKVYDFKWIDDFSAARNYSFSKATMEYILWLDADDVILPNDRKKLIKLKATLDPSVAVVMMKYNYAFDEYGNVSLCFYRERLVKRSHNPVWHDPIHEFIEIEGKTINEDICITHKRVHDASDRNLLIFEKMIEQGRAMSARNCFYYAKELYYHNRHHDAIKYFNKFLESGEGWVEDNINACYHLSICYDNIKDSSNMLKALLKSFEYDLPRAEICCQLGTYYFAAEEYRKAVFWYELATKLKKPEDNWGFILEDYWGFIPNIQLCVCYYRLGNMEESYKHNELAAKLKPDSSFVKYNRDFFNSLRKQNEAGECIMPVNESEAVGNEYKTKETARSQPKTLRIVQVAPDIYKLPPVNYGGIEMMVWEITEELVRRGHEVYLYAPKGTQTNARLIPFEHNDPWNEQAITQQVINTLPDKIDLIHDHTHHSLIGNMNLGIPTICTIHCPVNNHVEYPVYVSKRARKIYGDNYGFQVYNGINIDRYQFSEEKEDYLLYLGVLNYSKGTQLALDAAIRTNQRLVVAGPVHDQAYFDAEIAPRLKANSKLAYVGAVGGQEKQDLLKKARCVLFPTSFEEPFGLVMIEAMACGTPVLALKNGAVPEVLEEFPELVCTSWEDMADKILNLKLPEPGVLRRYVMRRFITQRMVDEYLEVYGYVLKNYPEPLVKHTKPEVFLPNANMFPKKRRFLRVAQVAPDYYPIPPKNYGGIERVVYDLTEELVKMGHEVYLFAPRGSSCSARIINYQHDSVSPYKIAEFVKGNLPSDMDIIHDHTHSSVIGKLDLDIPTVCTIHTPVYEPVKYPVFVSKSARRLHTGGKGYYVYNGINPDDFGYSEEKDDYILYMGMLAWYKGIVHALEAVEKTGDTLVLAGPVYDMDYHQREIVPRINANSNVKYIGEVGGKKRSDLLKHAKCMLLPTVCNEPFGLVMAEAMISGTPILALANGAVPEVLQEFPELICSTPEEMAEKLKHQDFPDPKKMRDYAAANFTRDKMAMNYLRIYEELIQRA
jgi:glycosyltransferase involved in cell wall biosynthesis